MAKSAKTPPNKGAPIQRPKLIMPRDMETVYSNMVRISHTPAEYIFDFARFLPGDMGAKVVSRVVMSPLGGKLLLRALQENIAKYEATYGEIKIPQKQTLADFLFKPPQKSDEDEDNNNDNDNDPKPE